MGKVAGVQVVLTYALANLPTCLPAKSDAPTDGKLAGVVDGAGLAGGAAGRHGRQPAFAGQCFQHPGDGVGVGVQLARQLRQVDGTMLVSDEAFQFSQHD